MVALQKILLGLQVDKNKKNKIRGTKRGDALTGSAGNDFVLGRGGDDIITTNEGDDKIKGGKGKDVITSGTGMDTVWGGKGDDVFVTENGSTNNPKEGYMKIMDFEDGDVIEFCGCASATLEQRGENVWLTKGDDVKAVIKGVNVEDLDIDFRNKIVTFAADPLA